MSLRLAPHHFEDPMNGRLLEIGQIHRDLCLPAYKKSCSLYKTQPASREAHRLRNFLRNINVGGVQENVVCDEELARAYNAGSGSGMELHLTKIRLARRVCGNLIANAFELAAPYVLQILPFG